MAEMRELYHDDTDESGERSRALSGTINILGAVMSLALVVGAGVWGYKLLSRDVSGVPVVRAAEGPMRIQPEDPGGEQASHQGLSVNNVAAVGAAGRPADRLILAPEPVDVSLDDMELSETGEDEELVTRNAEQAEALASDDEAVRLAAVTALADQIARDAEPLSELEEEIAALEPETEALMERQEEVEPEPAVVEERPKVEGGLGRSLRPKLRPASYTPVEAAVASLTDTGATYKDIDPDTIPPGTRLAQLGAFASAEIAREEWQKLSETFGEYLEGKDRVIQKAKSGGRTFYRLRALGFEDLSDARRFCSALVAEKTECIPVVTR